MAAVVISIEEAKKETYQRTRQRLDASEIGDGLLTMAAVKASGLSLPMLLVLAIVNDNFSAKYPMLYTGEVEMFFYEISPSAHKDQWSYNAIGRLLRILAKKGFLNRERHGRYVAYGMTRTGISTLKELGIKL